MLILRQPLIFFRQSFNNCLQLVPLYGNQDTATGLLLLLISSKTFLFWEISLFDFKQSNGAFGNIVRETIPRHE